MEIIIFQHWALAVLKELKRNKTEKILAKVKKKCATFSPVNQLLETEIKMDNFFFPRKLKEHEFYITEWEAIIHRYVWMKVLNFVWLSIRIMLTSRPQSRMKHKQIFEKHP